MRFATALLLAACSGCATVRVVPPAPKPVVEDPAYVKRGHQVEAVYQAYAAVYQQMYDELLASLKSEGLEHELETKIPPPRSMKVGYGLVPKINDDSQPPPVKRARVTITPFSWKINEQVIAYQLVLVEDVRHRLAALPSEPAERVARLKELAGKYQNLQRGKAVAESQIHYNWFWQGEIVKDQPQYDRNTLLLDKVAERQRIADALAANSGDAAQLRQRDAALAQDVAVARSEMHVPRFLIMSHPDPHHWSASVRLVTDIEDREFTESFRKAIEDRWKVDDGDDHFELKIQWVFITPQQLYSLAPPPAVGESIDLGKHLARFPPVGGVVTTGAESLHAFVGRAVLLPAMDIPPNVLAHEFGHLLGFPDRYFRGYHDQGPEGFEVLEAVPDMEDIMCAPGVGHVQRIHFERLFEAATPAT